MSTTLALLHERLHHTAAKELTLKLENMKTDLTSPKECLNGMRCYFHKLT